MVNNDDHLTYPLSLTSWYFVLFSIAWNILKFLSLALYSLLSLILLCFHWTTGNSFPSFLYHFSQLPESIVVPNLTELLRGQNGCVKCHSGSPSCILQIGSIVLRTKRMPQLSFGKYTKIKPIRNP